METIDIVALVTIVWPKRHADEQRLVSGCEMDIVNNATGKPLVSVVSAKVTLDPTEIVTVEMVMLVDTEGCPLELDPDQRPWFEQYDEAGDVLTATFRAAVTAFKFRE